MTNFSTNQVMQFYVHTTGHKLYIPDAENINGSFSIAITTDGDAPSTTDGKTTNAIGRTDKIENVMWATLTKASALETPYKEVTLAFKSEVNEGAPIVGQDYIVKVSYPAIGGVGVEGFTTKVATAYASAGSTTASIVDELAKNLNAAFEADGVLVATIDGEGNDTLVITQTDIAEKSYERGVRPVTIADFNVTAAPVIEDGEEVDWFDKTIAASDNVVNGGYKLADMEYFALGERGDEYRMMGYPNYIKSIYRIDPTKEYNVYNIHYAYKGYNDQSHKSEKDLIIAVEVVENDVNEGTIPALESALSALGVTLKVIPEDVVSEEQD